MSLDVNMSEPDEFNHVELHNGINEVAKIKGIDSFKYSVDSVSGKGEHYIANIFRVLIKDTEKSNQVSVIVKTLVNNTRKELFQELHKREVEVYEKVIPLFERLQSEFQDDKIVFPKCLYSSVEKDKEILILEDLLADGFAMDQKIQKFEKLDYLQVRLVLTELAKFHALSFLSERVASETYDNLKSQFDDMIFEEKFLSKGKLNNYFPECYQIALKVVKDEDAFKKLKSVENKFMPILRKFMQLKKYNVLCHGDFWINNIFFKYQEMKQGQACFFDFQAMRYASPVTDMIYFMYLCTNSAFRSEHFDTLQHIYYDTMKSILNISNINIKDVYPRSEFDADIQEYLPFGLLISLLELRLVVTSGYEDTKLKGSHFGSVLDLNEEMETPNLFEMAINDVVNESISNGVLDRLVDEINSLE